MGRFKDIAIALRNGDPLTSVERDYISTLSEQELDEYRGRADHSFDEYQEWKMLMEKEQKEGKKTLP